ncbi:MAG: transglutaminase domain-containing protein [Bacteroidales bacterium]
MTRYLTGLSIPCLMAAAVLINACKQLPQAPLPDAEEISRRISLDFSKTEAQVRESLAHYFPLLSDSQLMAWESDGRLEMRFIRGEKRYFNYAVGNLFRTDPGARQVRDRLYPPRPDPLDSICLQNTRAIVDAQNSGSPVVTMEITIEFSLTVDADAVPPGETIRCWLPFPKESQPRQTGVTLLSSAPKAVKHSSPTIGHSSLYAEQMAVAGQPTGFNYRASFQISGQWFDPELFQTARPKTGRRPSSRFTSEALPQVIFSDAVKALTDSLSGTETNPYQLIRRFYHWIDENIPWASAREYSTMDSIPDYVLRNKRGDCGMVTFLLLSMARHKGIPARWQSGWMLHPGKLNLHDWAEVWFAETGWIPVDQSFGLQESPDPRLREFYVSGIDSYRMIVNDGFAQPLDPPKQFPRSEPFDFQRGEVEWRNGNLYFNQWDYHLEVISIEPIPTNSKSIKQ